jgi:glutamate decarboxylase
MAPNAQHVSLLRVVVREDFCHTLAQRLVNDITRVLRYLDDKPSKSIKSLAAKLLERKAHPKDSDDAGKPHPLQLSSVFDRVLNSQKAFHVWKKNALHKTNGIC